VGVVGKHQQGMRLFSKPISIGEDILSLSDSSIQESLQNILNATIHLGEAGRLVFDGITITSKKIRSKQVDNLCCVAVDEG